MFSLWTFSIEHVWSLESPPEEHTVKVHIRGIRQKLKTAGADEDAIETVHGIGYRLKQLGDYSHR
jgi:DNA-binding response OmpR family regulator